MATGRITRGTTGANRLRRVDRWIANLPALRHAEHPLVVDLGFGASAVTPIELHQRLSRVREDIEVIGVEIDPQRVRVATEQWERWQAHRVSSRAMRGLPLGRSAIGGSAIGGHRHVASRASREMGVGPAVSFAVGGFEIPLPGNRRPLLIRAFNVLRQYDEGEVPAAWATMTARLQPGGLLVEGTCDELGRVASWLAVTDEGPQSLTLSLRLTELERPSLVAERLPKALIHRNVPGEGVHDLMTALDRNWRLNAALSVYAPRQRWIAMAAGLAADGWPVLTDPRRLRLGELTVAWSAVRPRTAPAG